MIMEVQQTPYQKEIVEVLTANAVRLPLPEMISALLDLGYVGNLVFQNISGQLDDPDREWRLQVAKNTEI